MHACRLTLCLVPLLLACLSTARAEILLPEVEVNDEGLHTHAWFLNSFLDLRDDIAEAAAAGRDFVIVWEQRGCPYCAEMHQVNLRIPEVVDYVRGNFHVLQLNILGAREVTDTDGEVLSEKQLAEKFGVQFTPTIQFFSHDTVFAAERSARDIEVWRLAGYWKPFHFLGSFVYVHEGAYRSEPRFQRWLKRYRARLEAAGEPVTIW